VNGTPVVLRERAHRDIDEAVEHYLAEAGPAVTLDFVDALEGALRQISEQPRKFPYLVFYVETAVEVDVWRVLHGSRDIPACVREPREA